MLLADMGKGDGLDEGKREGKRDAKQDIGDDEEIEAIDCNKKEYPRNKCQKEGIAIDSRCELPSFEEKKGCNKAHEGRDGKDGANLDGAVAKYFEHFWQVDHVDADNGEEEKVKGANKAK